MLSIINSLLLLSSTRSQSVVMQPIDMERIVTDIQQTMGSLIKEYNGQIIAPTTWPKVKGHADWIREVWANYIDNGLKYGGKSPQLELGATPENNGYVRFWVRDKGLGISTEEQKHLFIPFNRINQICIEGHGLGLSISKKLVNMMGGELYAKSVLGQGTTFWTDLQLPEATNILSI